MGVYHYSVPMYSTYSVTCLTCVCEADGGVSLQCTNVLYVLCDLPDMCEDDGCINTAYKVPLLAAQRHVAKLFLIAASLIHF